MRITLGISHAPWREERAASYARLLSSVGGPNALEWCAQHTFSDRAPNHVWSAAMWAWAADIDADWHLFLQDDVVVAPRFWLALRAMLAFASTGIVGLEAVHPMGRELALGGHRAYTTADMMIGPGYVVRHDHLVRFLDWRTSELHRGAIECISEDTLLGLYALSSGIHIHHPLPTLIDHDLTLPSTYGNDQHKHRRPLVTWRDGDVCGWNSDDLESTEWWTDSILPHLGRFYGHTPALARTWVKGCEMSDDFDPPDEGARKWL